MVDYEPLIPDTREKVRDYLDKAITIWRKKRDLAPGEYERLMAVHYIDAFQSVRVSLLGSLLE